MAPTPEANVTLSTVGWASVLSYELDLERRQYRVWGTPDQESRPLLRTRPDAGWLLRSIS